MVAAAFTSVVAEAEVGTASSGVDVVTASFWGSVVEVVAVSVGDGVSDVTGASEVAGTSEVGAGIALDGVSTLEQDSLAYSTAAFASVAEAQDLLAQSAMP